MNRITSKIARFWQLFVGRTFPTKLPVGMTALEDFSKTILGTYLIPDLPSYRQAIATMILHLGPTQDRVHKAHVARSLRKAMANQIAYEAIQRIKEEEKAKSEKPEGTDERPLQV